MHALVTSKRPVDMARKHMAEPEIQLATLNSAIGFANRLAILVPTCLAEAHLWLGALDEARLMHRLAMDSRVLEPHAALVLQLVDRLADELAGVAQFDDSGLDELCQATEGWTAGLRLITLA